MCAKERILAVPIVVFLAAGLLALAPAGIVQASPQFGGDCHYCHTGDQPDALAITGYTEILDGLKVFDIEPGGSVDFGLDVNNPGAPTFYRMVLRGLDRLDGVEPEHGTPQYFPRLYTPDPDPTWKTKSTGGVQYLFWEGQYYGTDMAFAPTAYNYHLEISPDVVPGLYDLTAYVAGGFPARASGQTPAGGWSYGEDFQLRVIPEPASLVLLVTGLGLCCLSRRWRRRAVPIVLVLLAGVLSTDLAQAYPSRAGDCSICHSIPGPSAQTGDFDIKDTAGNPTTSFTVAAGDSTEFRLDFTSLVEDSQAPGTYRRGYLVVDKLDLLNVDAGPPPAYEDIPYTAPKYTANVGEEAGQWHNGHYNYGPHRYFGQNGQYFAQSSTDPAATMLFPLDVAADVVPGTYSLTAKLAGGRPADPLYLNGWIVSKNFTLTVTPAAVASLAVPEPSAFVLIASGLGIFGLFTLRRRKSDA